MGRNRKKPVRHRLEKRQKRSRQKKKSGLFDKVTMVILVVAVCVFAFSLYQLVRTMVPYYSGGKEYDKLKNKAITVQEQTDDPGDVSGDTFKVDFDVLLQENPDTVAWIRFDEPSIISYPVVKSADNKEYLTTVFKKKYGLSIGEYVARLKIEDAKRQLRYTTKTMDEIMITLGYSDVSYFYRQFKKVEGISPGQYRKKYNEFIE